MATTILYGDEKLAMVTERVTLAKTLTASDSGKVMTLAATTGKTLALPAPLAGFNLRIYVGALFATTNYVISAPTAVIQGGAIVNSVFVPAENENRINLVATADTVGDYINIISDGVNYYVDGIGALAGSITFTVV